jgi:hypothetical protein
MLPTTCNWYQSGMLAVRLNGQQVPLLPEHGETVELVNGRKGMAVFAWDAPAARLCCTAVLFAGQDRLFVQIELEPKLTVQDLQVYLTNYPSGFNREPKHVLWTPVRTLDKPGQHRLDPAAESALFYSDTTLDVATNPAAAGPSAVAFDPAPVTGIIVHAGGYGVGTSIVCRADARRLSFCFWEFADRPNAEALAAFCAALPSARTTLTDAATFTR